jgi:hypothetical protein
LAARLLVVNDDGQLRLTHEALTREWREAREILVESQPLLELRHDLQPNVDEWLAHKELDLLLRGTRLKRAEILIDQLREMLPDTANIVAFIEESSREATRRLVASREQLALDREKLANYLQTLDFPVAAKLMEDMEVTLRKIDSHSEIPEVQTARYRVIRLSRFYTAARQAERLAGEEDFRAARETCAIALDALNQPEDLLSAYQALEGFGAKARPESEQIQRLEQTAYRLRLLFSTLQLEPAIKLLFPGSAKPKWGFLLASRRDIQLLGKVEEAVEAFARWLELEEGIRGLISFCLCSA